jgi:hypothetical protein
MLSKRSQANNRRNTRSDQTGKLARGNAARLSPRAQLISGDNIGKGREVRKLLEASRNWTSASDRLEHGSVHSSEPTIWQHTPNKTHKSAPNEIRTFKPEEQTIGTQGRTRVWTHVSTTTYSLSFTSHTQHKPPDTPHKKILFLHALVPHTPIFFNPPQEGTSPTKVTSRHSATRIQYRRGNDTQLNRTRYITRAPWYDLYQNRIDNNGVLLCQNHVMIHPIYQILSYSKGPM